MYLSRLGLHDFRSYASADIALESGPSVLLGPNGQGKTNVVEAVHYLATLGSHRVASDAPLVRQGCPLAVVRAEVRVGWPAESSRPTLVEVEIVPGRSNRARVNRAPLPRPREVLGLVRAVLFAPEDLTLVKGDPAERRRFLDELLVVQAPRLAGVRQDYDRVLRQRSSLLKTAGAARGAGALRTLDVWDAHLARTGAELLAARLALVDRLRPLVARAYAAVARPNDLPDDGVEMTYRSAVDLPDESPGGATPRAELAAALLAEVARRRGEELDRGVCLVGPHRDELHLALGSMPARGYASHGESWSLALALRLAAYELLRADGSDPVLVLDDVFAELDGDRRDRLGALVAPAEQVLVTAAVADDVPKALAGARFEVLAGQVRRVV